MKIPFNKPYFTGSEADHLIQAAHSGHISGNGFYTKKCHRFFEEKYGFEKVLLTNSCTDALEMAAILADIEPGDEVIVPSYAFVSTANAFILRGAKVVFADSEADHPNLDVLTLESLITENTKAIVVIHYAGVACDMLALQNLCVKHNLFLIEDAAQAIDAYCDGQSLGSFGHFACFSFHETKNIISGEGGMLVVNDKNYAQRAEIIWEKGTNRAAFFRGEVDKYGWVDIGSSYLPSELVAAFLYGQLENLEDIQQKRMKIWNFYQDSFSDLAQKGYIKQPYIPEGAQHNAHLYYLLCRSEEERTALILHLKENGIQAVFHYLPLHISKYFADKHDGRSLHHAIKFANQLVRLPFYYTLTKEEQQEVVDKVNEFFL